MLLQCTHLKTNCPNPSDSKPYIKSLAGLGLEFGNYCVLDLFSLTKHNEFLPFFLAHLADLWFKRSRLDGAGSKWKKCHKTEVLFAPSITGNGFKKWQKEIKG